MRKKMVLFFAILCLMVVVVIYSGSTINQPAKIDSAAVSIFVQEKYNSEKFDYLSNYLTPDKLYYYTFMLNKENNEKVLALVTRNGDGYNVSLESVYQNNNSTIDVLKLGESFYTSVIDINNKKIKHLEITDSSETTWEVKSADRGSLYFNGEILIIRGYDEGKNNIFYYCYEENYCKNKGLLKYG
ncbi:hypothetical protein [Paenibacillus sp. KS-LC4]|uniref:hypothetical protein n=1 Tax=Paenibacillus sp. KS-LC4 TaxID=2979727 RepID=UPI0030CC83FC